MARRSLIGGLTGYLIGLVVAVPLASVWFGEASTGLARRADLWAVATVGAVVGLIVGAIVGARSVPPGPADVPAADGPAEDRLVDDAPVEDA